jgi:hypothetical protein
MKRRLNDQQLVSEYKALREAKEELRQFERNMD